MASGQLNSRELTHGYIRRIQSLNPLLHSVIELNPNAIAIATQLDSERRRGSIRGPLHGIPLLVKDNIATDDQMQTTAGSLAIYGSHVPGDAVIIQQLRAAGAIILGNRTSANGQTSAAIFLFIRWRSVGARAVATRRMLTT